MAVWLLFALVGVAGLYFLLQSEFLAAVQLVIYVGGTLILILFGVMLTSKSPFAHFEPGRGEVIVAVSLAAVLLGALVLAIRAGDFGSASAEQGTRYRVDALGQALLGDYLVPFELASVLLLVVMIGAAYLAKARRREDEPPVARGAAAVSQLTTKARRWHRD
jgi:NADH:ubiquinone oxidoreductase subunit 6 (subunit J)